MTETPIINPPPPEAVVGNAEAGQAEKQTAPPSPGDEYQALIQEVSRPNREKEINCRDLVLAIMKEAMADDKSEILVQENSPDNWKEARKTIIYLKEMFARGNFKEKLGSLHNKEQYGALPDQLVEMVVAFVKPVYDGKLAASDMAHFVQGVKVTDRKRYETELSPEQTGRLKAGGATGQEVMYYDSVTKEIIIFEESLVDNYENVGKLDIYHMITHEIAHGVVRALVPGHELGGVNEKEPKGFTILAKQIIDGAVQFLPLLPLHLRSVITDRLKNCNYDPTALSEAQKAEVESKFGSMAEYNRQRICAADEIITEYTALYLMADGKFSSFAQTILEHCNQTALNDALGTNGRNAAESKSQFLSIAKRMEAGTESPNDIINSLPDKTQRDMVVVLWKFFQTINKLTKEHKGAFGEIEDEDYDLSDMADYYDGFVSQDRGSNDAGAKKSTGNIGAFFGEFFLDFFGLGGGSK